MWGHSHHSLVVDIVKVVLSASDVDRAVLDDESEVESVELGEENELSSEGHVVGDEGLWGTSVLSLVEGCAVPLREIRCMSNMLRHNSTCGGGPEMGL